MNDSTETPRRRKPKGRAKFAIIAVAGAALIGAGAWKVFFKGEDQGEYMFDQVQVGSIEDLVTATGTLEPRDYVDVGAQVSGQIEEIYVEIGDEVKAGDRLAKIDATTSEARVEANKANLRSSETGLLTQRNNLEKAERDYQRQLNLRKEDATTEEALINARTTLENARNQIVQSEAGIAQQKANMRIEEKNLQYTTIVAPIDGTVMSIAVKEGQTVNASQNVPNVMRIANLSTMTVRADVSEADYAKIYKGMPVYFTTLGAGQQRRWYSEVKRIEPTPKNQQGVTLFPVLFDVQNDGTSLAPQMTTQVFFIAAQANNVLTVPMSALQQGQQIARERMMKEREERGETGQAGGPPRPQVADAAAAAAPAGTQAPVAGGSATATAPDAAQANAGSAPGAGPEGQGMRANRQAGNREGGNGQRAGGNFGGQRPGGGNFGGQRPGGGNFGGFDPSQMTPEMREQMAARMRERGGAGGFGGGGPGGFGGMGMPGGGGNARQPQQRRGIVMVKLADGTLEQRNVVVGVNDRVLGEVIEGLKEGEEVVIAKREKEPQTGPTASGNNNNNNNNFRGNQGFPGGGRPF